MRKNISTEMNPSDGCIKIAGHVIFKCERDRFVTGARSVSLVTHPTSCIFILIMMIIIIAKNIIVGLTFR